MAMGVQHIRGTGAMDKVILASMVAVTRRDQRGPRTKPGRHFVNTTTPDDPVNPGFPKTAFDL
jgi:hypothetical protein